MEYLEPRLLFAATASVMHSDAIYLHGADTSSSVAPVDGYSPSQISQAYQFNQVKLAGGAAADGTGQTIAIVDAYNDPKIASDLSVFDQQFDLDAPPSLKVVNGDGGSTLPKTDAGWAGEISLDVEWAHAMAPGANILLVEANSDSLNDLMDAVNYARNAAGVSVVSMSWGGSEFFGWNGTEFTGQTQYDPYFTTPAGHQCVTFVAAAGDSGVFSGVQWPAISPNVLSVGGTSLYVGDTAGTYYTENSWSGTSGGYSDWIENEPPYQDMAQQTGWRSSPDVAFDADPDTGFAVYDSVADQGYLGWQVVGGTSAGAPQWAALVAIADQGRVAAGHGTLDGAQQVLPQLYALYVSQGGPTYSQYTSDFNDVIDGYGGGGGHYHWRFGGGIFGSANPATAGYDTSTGLGTPKAGAVADALINTTFTYSGAGNGTTGGGNNGGANGSPQQLPQSQLQAKFTNTPLASIIAGNSGMLRLRVTNSGDTRFGGPVSITLYASANDQTDSTSLAADTAITTATFSDLNIGPGKSKIVPVRFDYPSGLAEGAYFLIASLDEMGMDTADSVNASASTVRVSAASVDLAAAFAASGPAQVRSGGNSSVVVTIKNLGNVAAIGTLNLSLYASADQNLNTASDTLLTAVSGRAIHIPPGRTMHVRLTFGTPSNLAPGDFYLIASADSSTQPTDSNSANDIAVSATRS